MALNTNSFEQIHHRASLAGANSQDKNRIWWESLPMTYADWDGEQRVPKTLEDFDRIEYEFLYGNPWISENVSFNVDPSQRVLEIGCGSGVASRLFAKGKAGMVHGVDITSKSIEISQHGASLQALSNVQFDQQDAEHLIYDDNKFDIVFSWGVLHHSTCMEAAIQEAVRVLKPGGSGIIMVYNKLSLRYYGKGLSHLLLKGKLFQGYNLATVQKFFTDGYFHRHVTPREFERILLGAGASAVKMSTTHMAKKYLPFVPRVIDEYFKVKYGWLLVAEFSKY